MSIERPRTVDADTGFLICVDLCGNKAFSRRERLSDSAKQAAGN